MLIGKSIKTSSGKYACWYKLPTWLDLLDLMPWRRRCSPRALAAQVAYDAPPLMSIVCSSGGFSERQLQSVAVLLDVVYPLLPWSSLGSTFGVCPWRRVCGYLSGCIRETCPKYVSLRFCSSSTTSSSMSNAFIMSIFLFRSLLVTPQILLSTAIPNTRSFLWCSCFSAHVSALYNTTDWTNVLHNVTLLTLLISLAVYSVQNFITILYYICVFCANMLSEWLGFMGFSTP